MDLLVGGGEVNITFRGGRQGLRIERGTRILESCKKTSLEVEINQDQQNNHVGNLPERERIQKTKKK